MTPELTDDITDALWYAVQQCEPDEMIARQLYLNLIHAMQQHLGKTRHLGKTPVVPDNPPPTRRGTL